MASESFQPLKVAVIGTGYVGLTTGVALAHVVLRSTVFFRERHC